MPDIQVFFACPSYSKHPCYEFSISARMTQRLLDINGIPSVWCDLGGDPYIHKVRNRFASRFVDDFPNCTHLFFLDDDLGWEPEAVIRFLKSPFDVITGIYPKKENDLNFPVELTFEKTELGEIKPIVEQGCYLANLAPTGFMCIRREVLEAAAKDSIEYQEPDPNSPTGSVRCYDIFRTGTIPFSEGSKQGRWWGEDYFFCVIAKSLGFSVWVDPNVEFSHRGSNAWRASFAPTLQRKIMALQTPVRPQAVEFDVKISGSASLSTLTDAVFCAFHKRGSILDENVRKLPGMSGCEFRDFLNNLVGIVPNPRYLEVGTYTGSTAISALYGNVNAWATLIDNWSQFGGPSAQFHANMARFIGGALPYALLEQDFRKVDYTSLGPPHNIYFFDGPHTREDQIDAVTVALPALASEWIYIVDDWNRRQVREGTFGGIYASGFDVLYSIEVRTTLDDTEQVVSRFQDSAWHNGVFIAVLMRKTADVPLALAAE